MADISDVEQALVNLISSLIYPSGTGQPSALPAGAPVIVHRGWPLATDLTMDIPASKSHVSVFPRGGTERNTTRYPVDYQTTSESVPTLTAAVQNNTITIGGHYDTMAGQFVTVMIGSRFVTSYQPVAGDTPTTIAAALAALINSGLCPASAANGVITVSTGAYMSVIVGHTGSQLAEIRRQMTEILITLWCPTVALRDALAKLLEPALADTTFLTMPDDSACRLRYVNSIVSDSSDKVQISRRDLCYNVEYATTLSDTATEVTAVVLNQTIQPLEIGSSKPGPTTTTNAPSPEGVTAQDFEGAPFVPFTPN